MNCSHTQPTMLPSRPLTERIAAGVGQALRAMQIARKTLWRERKVRSDELRAFASIAHLNEHELKDIGAPHWLVAHAVERREAQHLRWIEMDLR